MKPSEAPTLATWFLEHLRSGPSTDSLIGDLIEEYRNGRSKVWYWKQVLGAILVSFYRELMDHPMLALRAVAVGWAIVFALGRLEMWLLIRLIRHHSFFFGLHSSWLHLFIMCLIGAGSGWIVGRFHRAHQTGMVLAFAVSAFILRGGVWLPLVWSSLVDAFTNTRFLSYLQYNLATLTLPPLSILLGGFRSVPLDSRSEAKYIATPEAL